jgi:hypothetical protein
MSRELVQINEDAFLGFGCSDCDWCFDSRHIPFGQSFAEFVRNFERQRDKEFREHACEKRKP